MSMKLNALIDLEAKEVSLVKRGANLKKRFPIFKEKNEMDMNEIIKAVLETEIDGEDVILKNFDGQELSDKAVTVIKGILRLGDAFCDELPEDLLSDLNKIVKQKETKKTKKPDEEYTAPENKKKQKENDKEIDEEEEEDLSMSKNMKKEMDPEVESIFKAQEERILKAEEKAEKLEKQLETVQKDTVRKELIQKCATEYSFVPGMNAEKMGDMLQKAYELGEDFGKELEAQWKATSEAIEKSNLLQSQGVRASGEVAGSPMEKLNTIAKEIAGREKISFAKAFDQALVENKDLYNAYLLDNPAQSGKRA